MFRFNIEKRLPKSSDRSGRGRAGIIKTPHGNIETPAFIPVGTKATIKALLPEQVRDLCGAQAVLGNTYHLYLQPGAEIVRKAGGLGMFMNWSGPTFTDSGGFQAFSLQGGLKDRSSKFADFEKEQREHALRNTSQEIPSKEFPRCSAGSAEPDACSEVHVPAAPLATVDDDGVTFKSIIDGSTHR
ncbi:MAG: tRNA-guanine transglycosylase, partial [Candidatus Taylorbacteria bacterium]|nr:tRNA-guanine transglycosylase [Candidatus Taylorbacteria bacterium]